jgi:pyrroloquinoline-quinone synthase
MTVMAAVDRRIAAQRLLDHPFYAAWSSGALSRDALERYAEQYYHWTQAFPTFLSLTHAQCPDLAARQVILENLIDEEMGPNNHPELWLRFCDALGLERSAVKASEVLPETRDAIDAMRGVCGSAPFGAGLAALYAYESQQPEVMTTKRAGLNDLYDVTTGHDFFIEHETADVRHSAQERDLIERHADGHEEAIELGAQVGLDATYELLNGVYERYVAEGALAGEPRAHDASPAKGDRDTRGSGPPPRHALK